jgi:hypothetical protein
VEMPTLAYQPQTHRGRTRKPPLQARKREVWASPGGKKPWPRVHHQTKKDEGANALLAR